MIFHDLLKEADGSVNDSITDMTVEYQDTSAKRVKNKIEDAYKEATGE